MRMGAISEVFLLLAEDDKAIFTNSKTRRRARHVYLMFNICSGQRRCETTFAVNDERAVVVDRLARRLFFFSLCYS